jgi:NADH pyrophosphatase NudC (nudix superfamily)
VVTANGTPLRAEGAHAAGFEWGYEGAACAELARALLRHHLEDRIPHPFIYQRVMKSIVRPLPHADWEITSASLEIAMKQALRAIDRTCPLCADCGYRQLPNDHEDACECPIGRRLFNAPQKASHGGAKK